ncbi:MAG: hypothetical protein GX606_00615 [Elusimicrobia bacterium]|nr:hypothetical protein [Elusimicrobiota bacterium]
MTVDTIGLRLLTACGKTGHSSLPVRTSAPNPGRAIVQLQRDPGGRPHFLHLKRHTSGTLDNARAPVARRGQRPLDRFSVPTAKRHRRRAIIVRLIAGMHSTLAQSSGKLLLIRALDALCSPSLSLSSTFACPTRTLQAAFVHTDLILRVMSRASS